MSLYCSIYQGWGFYPESKKGELLSPPLILLSIEIFYALSTEFM